MQKTFKVVKVIQEWVENPAQPMDSHLKREIVQTGLTMEQSKQYRREHKAERLEIVPEV